MLVGEDSNCFAVTSVMEHRSIENCLVLWNPHMAETVRPIISHF